MFDASMYFTLGAGSLYAVFLMCDAPMPPHIPPLYLPCISTTSPLYLPCISPMSAGCEPAVLGMEDGGVVEGRAPWLGLGLGLGCGLGLGLGLGLAARATASRRAGRARRSGRAAPRRAGRGGQRRQLQLAWLGMRD